MRSLCFLLVLLACFFTSAQANLLSHVSELPTCGLPCILNSITASECKSIANETCVCTNTALHAKVQECLLKQCSVIDALKIQKIQSDACGVEPRNRVNTLVGLIAVEVITFLCIVVRLYSRWSILGRFETDDFVMMGTLLIWIAFTVMGEYSRITAFGRDIWEVEPQAVTNALMVFYIDEAFYLLLLALTKISVLGFYMRVFPGRGFRQVVLITMGVISVTTFAFIMAQVFQCTPINSIWLSWKDTNFPKKCVDIQSMAFASAAFNIFFDLVVMALPFPFLVKLQTSLRKKIGIMFMFSLGILVVVISCLRLPHLHLFTTTLNPTWDFTDALIWTAIEVHVSIIIACMPAIRQLLSKYLPKLFGGSSAQSVPDSFAMKGSRFTPASHSDGSQGRKPHWKSESIGAPREMVRAYENESQEELGNTLTAGSDFKANAMTAYPIGSSSDLSEDDGSGHIHITRTVNITGAQRLGNVRHPDWN